MVVRIVTVVLITNLLGFAAAYGAGDRTSPVFIYKTQDDFDTVKENLELAIMDRGLIVSGTLHVNDMLTRTGNDLGYPKAIYEKAESIEFCSASMSHRMVNADPSNLVVCPFTIGIYILNDDPNTVNIAFSRHSLAGDAAEVSKALFEMLDGIVREAIE